MSRANRQIAELEETAPEAQCPFSGGAIAPEEELAFPHARAVAIHVEKRADGEELRLYFAEQEISFDTSEQVAFGKELAKARRFRAADALQWSGMGWAQVSELLQQLVDHGVLYRCSEEPADVRVQTDERPSPLPRAASDRPRDWTDAERVMAELTGTALEPAYLETVVPVFRTAHMFLDSDGRQIGEANVFPKPLRLDVATEWRTCPYSGTRFGSDQPMNISALRAMRAHWRQMMALLLELREAYLRRFPDARNGWTVGHIERVSTAALALPSYLLLRYEDRVASGDLHPALSNLFRVMDGLRMTVHQMLFVPTEAGMLKADEPLTMERILAFTEQQRSFHSEHGVCAGPAFMIEEMLSVLLYGTEPKSGMPDALDPEIEQALANIEPALDYAFLGLQTYGAVFSLWPAMARAFDQLAAILGSADGNSNPEIVARFRRHAEQMRDNAFLAQESWRQHREAVYEDMYDQCVYGRAGRHASPSLAERLGLRDEVEIAMARVPLVQAIAAAVGRTGVAQECADIILAFLARGRSILALAEESQAELGALLKRPAPVRRLKLQDINLHRKLLGADAPDLPYLTDELQDLFGIAIDVDSSRIAITRRPEAPVCDPITAFDRHDAGRINACAMHVSTPTWRAA